MGDVVADPADLADQQFEPVEHGVDVRAEQAETVGVRGDGKPAVEVATDDARGHLSDRVDLARGPAPGEQPEGQGHQQPGRQPDQQRPFHRDERLLGIVEVHARQQPGAVGHRAQGQARDIAGLARQLGGRHRRDHRSPICLNAAGQSRDVAGDEATVGREQGEEAVAMNILVKHLANLPRARRSGECAKPQAVGAEATLGIADLGAARQQPEQTGEQQRLEGKQQPDRATPAQGGAGARLRPEHRTDTLARGRCGSTAPRRRHPLCA